MNFNHYKKYIVVDENYRPMAFDGDQFCYCQTHHNRSPHPLKIYTKKKAELLIKITVEFRTGLNFSVGEYHLMPVAPKIKNRK